MFAHTVSTIGGIYFVFINTLKMDKAMLIRTVKKTWSVSMTALFVPLLISLLISHMLRDHIPGIHKGRFYYYRSSLASISSFAVVVDATSELNLLKSDTARCVRPKKKIIIMIKERKRKKAEPFTFTIHRHTLSLLSSLLF